MIEKQDKDLEVIDDDGKVRILAKNIGAKRTYNLRLMIKMFLIKHFLLLSCSSFHTKYKNQRITFFGALLSENPPFDLKDLDVFNF